MVLVGLLGGVGLWLVLRKPAAPPAAPCTVGGSYYGFGATTSCSEFEKGAEFFSEGVSSALSRLTGDTNWADMEGQAKFANDVGKVWRCNGEGKAWDACLPKDPLPAGQVNAVVNGRIALVDQKTREVKKYLSTSTGEPAVAGWVVEQRPNASLIAPDGTPVATGYWNEPWTHADRSKSTGTTAGAAVGTARFAS
jgi:hypothetical protein